MGLLIALAVLTLLSFFVFFSKSKYSRESYLLFNGYFLPLMSLGVTPAAFGGLQVFAALAYFAFFFFIKDFIFVSDKNKVYFYLFSGLMVILLTGSFYSEFVTNSLFSILSVLPIFIFSRLLLKELSANPDLVYKMIRTFQWSFMVAAAFIVMQMLVGIKFSFYEGQGPGLNPNISDAEGIRYPGFFMDAQMNTQFLGMLSFLFLVNFKNILKPAPINYALFSLTVIAVFLSGGRSGFLGLAAGFCFLILFMGWRMRYFIGLGTFIAAVSMSFLKGSFILLQRMNTFDDSYTFRAYIWKEAYNIFLDHKFLGIGIGNYKDYTNHYSSDQYYILKDNSILLLDQPENGYLKLLTEFGIIGFAISLLLILIPISKAMYTHLETGTNHFALFCIASIICWLVSFNSLYTLSDERITVLLTSLTCFVIKSNAFSLAGTKNKLINTSIREQLLPL